MMLTTALAVAVVLEAIREIFKLQMGPVLPEAILVVTMHQVESKG